jgi:nucleotide-binding universal stress UspA family protein
LRAKDMCLLHGVEADVEGVTSKSSPEIVIQNKAEELGVTMVVLGAFGHTGIREFLFGSTTEHLLEKSKFSLFIHH